MDDAALVGGGQPAEGIAYVANRIGHRDAPLFHQGLEGIALDQFHDHEDLVTDALRGAQSGDVGVFERSQDADLTQESV